MEEGQDFMACLTDANLYEADEIVEGGDISRPRSYPDFGEGPSLSRRHDDITMIESDLEESAEES